MIQAVILAGGLGTRMRPLTDLAPKPMLPVGGRPFLEHLIELLRANGIGRYLLLVSYLGHQIEAYFGDGSSFGVHIEYGYETEPLGTGGAVRQARCLLDDEFLLVNGDTLLAIDYRRFLDRFRNSQATGQIAAYRNRAGNTPSNLALDATGLAVAYGKQQPTGDYIDAGVSAFRRSVIDYLPETGKCSFEQEVFPRLIAEHRLLGWPTETSFYDMGTPAGLQALEAFLNAAQARRA